MNPSDINTETIVRICRAGGAVRVTVFASLARGDADPDSDVDLLVGCSTMREDSVWPPSGFRLK